MTQTKTGPRTPLGQRPRTDVAQTVLRVVGKPATTARTPVVDALDVAAFNSFAD